MGLSLALSCSVPPSLSLAQSPLALSCSVPSRSLSCSVLALSLALAQSPFSLSLWLLLCPRSLTLALAPSLLCPRSLALSLLALFPLCPCSLALTLSPLSLFENNAFYIIFASNTRGRCWWYDSKSENFLLIINNFT